MSRQCGAIDQDKQNAILEAAMDVAAAARPSLAAVACKAGVSRQTVYNQFGGAAGLNRAVLERCRAALCEPFEDFPDQPDSGVALAAYVESALMRMRGARYRRALRALVQVMPDDKAVANALCAQISADCTASLRAFFRQETRAGRLEGADPAEAADEFHAMAMAGTQLRVLAGLCDEDETRDVSARARAVADLFLQQYSTKRKNTRSTSSRRASSDSRAENLP